MSQASHWDKTVTQSNPCTYTGLRTDSSRFRRRGRGRALAGAPPVQLEDRPVRQGPLRVHRQREHPRAKAGAGGAQLGLALRRLGLPRVRQRSREDRGTAHVGGRPQAAVLLGGGCNRLTDT